MLRMTGRSETKVMYRLFSPYFALNNRCRKAEFHWFLLHQCSLNPAPKMLT